MGVSMYLSLRSCGLVLVVVFVFVFGPCLGLGCEVCLSLWLCLSHVLDGVVRHGSVTCYAVVSVVFWGV